MSKLVASDKTDHLNPLKMKSRREIDELEAIWRTAINADEVSLTGNKEATTREIDHNKLLFTACWLSDSRCRQITSAFDFPFFKKNQRFCVED